MRKSFTRSLAAAIAVVVGAAALIPAATASAAGPNLIANPGFETASGANPASWQSNKWGTNTAQFKYDTAGRSGNRAASVTVSGYSSGDAKWYFTPVTVTPGKTYTFSNWYKSGVASGLDAAITTTAGAEDYQWIASVPASAAWKQQTFKFTAPANAKTVTFYHYLDKNGTLSVDDYSLTQDDGTTTPTPTPTPPTPTPPTPTPPAAGNLVANPSVETANGNAPAGWTNNTWGTNTTNFGYETNGQDGSRSLKATVSAYTSGDAKWYFNPVTATPGAVYTYSEYYKSDVVTEVDAMVTMNDGTVAYYWLGSPAAASNWTKLSYQFTAPANAKTVTIFHVISKKGYVQNDNFSFTKQDATSNQLNRGLVSLTFDDGWRNIHASGLPALKKYGLPSTQYLNSTPIVGGYPDYMTYQMVKDFKTQGSELAWHTRSHADITTLTAANLTTELTIPQNFLTGTGTTAAEYKNFASPYGAYNASSVAAVMAKYQSHRSTDVGYNGKTNFDATNIKVQNITNTTTPADVQSWVNQAIANKTWLVIVYHEVTTSPVDPTYSVTPANLDAELNIVKQSGVTVKTVDQALAEIKSQL